MSIRHSIVRGILDRPPRERLAARSRGQRFLDRQCAGRHDSAARREDWPANFDPLPLVLSASEWELISKGAAQRAAALNQFLAGFYSEQGNQSDGIVADDTLGIDGVLTAMFGLRPPGGVHCHICALTLAQSPHGEFQVLRQSAEFDVRFVRIVLNREAQRRALFDNRWQQHVRPAVDPVGPLKSSVAACSGVEHARTAVLDPPAGIACDTRHLAAAMRADTVSRPGFEFAAGRLFTRIAGRRKPVDVLLRPSVGDRALDPLASDSASPDGIAGLLDIYRNGDLTLVNSPGNAIAEDPALFAAMPELVARCCGEEAVLNNVGAGWRNRHDQRPGRAPQTQEPPIHGQQLQAAGGFREMSGAQSAQNRDMSAHPVSPLRNAFCVAGDGGLCPQPLCLTVFAVTGPQGVEVLPGGVATAENREDGAGRLDETARPLEKDVWILRD